MGIGSIRQQEFWCRFVVPAFLVIGALLLFSPVLQLGFFIVDDPEYVTSNQTVLSGLTWGGLLYAATFTVSNWHPLTILSHMADVSLFGIDPAWHHATNLLLHALNALLVYAVLLSATGERWRSVAVAALFAVHPMRVESVAWIAERKDLLCATFFMAALLPWLRYVRCGRARHLWTSVGLLALALMSKPMAVTFPFVLLLIDVWPLRRSDRFPTIALWVEKWPFFLLSTMACVLAVPAQEATGALKTSVDFALGARLGNAAFSVVEYIRLTAWPMDLAIFYPHRGVVISAGVVVTAFLLVSGVSILAAWRSKPVAIGFFWFLGMLVPVLGIVQVGDQGMADRYMYLPHVGLFVAGVWGVCDLLLGKGRRIPWGSVGLAFLLVLLFCFAWQTRIQLGLWADPVALFRRTLAVTEGNDFAHANLGQLLLERGDVKEAKDHFRMAVLIAPTKPESVMLLGIAEAMEGDFANAETRFADLLRMYPDSPIVHFNAGSLRELRGDWEGALFHYRKALDRSPGYRRARERLDALVGRGGVR